MLVKVRNNNVEKAVKVFKNKCADILFEYNNRGFYEKPSIIKRRKRESAKERERRRNRNAENKFQ